MSESEFSPRQNSLYVAYDVWAVLGYVAKATNRTREGVAEAVLRTWAAQEHPDLLEYLSKRSTDDNAFRSKLKAKLFGKDPLQ